MINLVLSGSCKAHLQRGTLSDEYVWPLQFQVWNEAVSVSCVAFQFRLRDISAGAVSFCVKFWARSCFPYSVSWQDIHVMNRRLMAERVSLQWLCTNNWLRDTLIDTVPRESHSSESCIFMSTAEIKHTYTFFCNDFSMNVELFILAIKKKFKKFLSSLIIFL